MAYWLKASLNIQWFIFGKFPEIRRSRHNVYGIWQYTVFSMNTLLHRTIVLRGIIKGDTWVLHKDKIDTNQNDRITIFHWPHFFWLPHQFPIGASSALWSLMTWQGYPAPVNSDGITMWYVVMVGWRKSRNSIPLEVAAMVAQRKTEKQWSAWTA